MKKLATIFLIVFSVTMAFASEPEAKNPMSAKTSQIEGKVVDGITGEALVGVCLKVIGKDMKTYSDLDGNFLIEGVEQGTYDIKIDYVSYQDITLKSVSANSTDVKLKVELASVSPERP